MFQARFGAQPRWFALAPGRINLIGEHTDYNEGFVLPAAIDLRCAAVAAPSRGRGSRLYSEDVDEEWVFDAGAPLKVSSDANHAARNSVVRGSPLSYAAGVVAGFQRSNLAHGELDIVVASGVPIGAGLASSAAVEVAVATVLEAAWSVTLDPLQKALLCQRAEHEFACVPCGIMDQLTSVMGRPGHLLLIDCRTLEVTPVPLPAADAVSILVADTGIRHQLASGQYAQRRNLCSRACAAMGIHSLRDATPELLEKHAAAMGNEAARCARHIMHENARTQAAARSLALGDFAAAGALMNESHASLRDDYRVSIPPLDFLADCASRAPGVYGAKMTGAGFGGAIVALVQSRSVQEVSGRLESMYQARFGTSCRVFTVRPSEGCRHGAFGEPGQSSNLGSVQGGIV